MEVSSESSAGRYCRIKAHRITGTTLHAGENHKYQESCQAGRGSVDDNIPRGDLVARAVTLFLGPDWRCMSPDPANAGIVVSPLGWWVLPPRMVTAPVLISHPKASSFNECPGGR